MRAIRSKSSSCWLRGFKNPIAVVCLPHDVQRCPSDLFSGHSSMFPQKRHARAMIPVFSLVLRRLYSACVIIRRLFPRGAMRRRSRPSTHPPSYRIETESFLTRSFPLKKSDAELNIQEHKRYVELIICALCESYSRIKANLPM